MWMRGRKHFVVLIAGAGMLLSTLDTGIMNVALPFLKEQFHTSASLTAFSVVGYTMSLVVFILPLGVLSDRIGKLKVAFWGFLIFGISSFFCGLANGVLLLIAFRILQGIGAAALQATSAALITTLIDRKDQNKALGVLGIMIGLGPVLGPSLGGLLLSLDLWRFIFWINLPFSILGGLCCYRLNQTIKETLQKKHLDLKGSTMNALMVVLLLSGFFFCGQQRVLLGAALLLGGAATGILFWRTEMKIKSGIILISIFEDRPEAFLYLAETGAFGFATAMIFLLPPFLFEVIYKLNVGVIGLLVLGTPLGLMIFSKISGKQNHGSKNNVFSTLGLIIIFLSLVLMLLIDPGWPYILVTAFLFMYGMGGGYFQPANISAIMQLGTKNMQGSIGSLQRMIQNIGIVCGTSVGSAIINLCSHNLLRAVKISLGITTALIMAILIATAFFQNDLPLRITGAWHSIRQSLSAVHFRRG